MSLIGVPILTMRFFGVGMSPFSAATLLMSGSPSNTAFAIALIVATFWTIVPFRSCVCLLVVRSRGLLSASFLRRLLVG